MSARSSMTFTSIRTERLFAHSLLYLHFDDFIRDHSQGFEFTYRWLESQYLTRLPSTASRSTTLKYSSNLPRSQLAASASLNSLDHNSECISEFTQSRPPSACPNSLDHGLPVHHCVHSISVSKYISKLAESWPQSASPNSLDHSLKVYLQTRSIMASKFKQWGPPIASSNLIDHGLKVHLQTRSVTASKCIPNPARSRPPSASLSSLNLSDQLHFQSRPIMASECISEFTQLSSSGAPRIADNHCVLPVQIHHV